MLKVIMMLLCSLLLIGCNKIEIQQQIFSVEAGTEILYEQLISCDQDVELEVISELIDSKKVGEYTVTYNIKRNKKVQEHSIQLKVTDTTAPSLKQLKKIFEYGSSVDIKSFVSASDICDEAPKIEVISGNINTNVAGDYEIEFKVSDDMGNSAVEKFIFTVEEKKYTHDEIVSFIQEEVKEINSNHNDILECKVDEFGTGLTVQYSGSILCKAEYDNFLGILPALMVVKDDSRKLSLGFILMPVDDEIFQDPYKFYIKSSNGQVELENLSYDGYEYSSGFFISSVLCIVADEVEYRTDYINEIISVASGDNVRARLSGNHQYDASLPSDMSVAIAELTKLFKETLNMYN